MQSDKHDVTNIMKQMHNDKFIVTNDKDSLTNDFDNFNGTNSM